MSWSEELLVLWHASFAGSAGDHQSRCRATIRAVLDSLDIVCVEQLNNYTVDGDFDLGPV